MNIINVLLYIEWCKVVEGEVIVLTYEGLLAQPGEQQEGVQVSVLHEGQHHHGDGQSLPRSPLQAHSYCMGHRVNQQ